VFGQSSGHGHIADANCLRPRSTDPLAVADGDGLRRYRRRLAERRHVKCWALEVIGQRDRFRYRRADRDRALSWTGSADVTGGSLWRRSRQGRVVALLRSATRAG
jgi:hypothetical protein